MADNFQKRQRERNKQEKQLAKQTQRLAARASNVKATRSLETEDPDIAGIVAGPQAVDQAVDEQWQTNNE